MYSCLKKVLFKNSNSFGCLNDCYIKVRLTALLEYNLHDCSIRVFKQGSLSLAHLSLKGKSNFTVTCIFDATIFLSQTA